LEIDYQTGKVSQSDFEAMSLEYKREYLLQKEQSAKQRA